MNALQRNAMPADAFLANDKRADFPHYALLARCEGEADQGLAANSVRE